MHPCPPKVQCDYLLIITLFIFVWQKLWIKKFSQKLFLFQETLRAAT